jgi:hypothetical protein
MKKCFSSSLLILLTLSAFANDAQEAIMKAKHGGLVKKTNNAIIEVVQDQEHTSIYITGHDHKNMTNEKLSLSAIARIGNKEFPMQLSFENDHYSARPANSYMHKERNMVLMLTVKFPNSVDRATFNLGKNLNP